MEWEIWQIWAAIALGLFVLEVFMPGFVLACLGIGAIGASIIGAIGLDLTWQLMSAGMISLLAFVFLRPMMLKMGFSGDEAVSGVDALIGKKALVTASFSKATGMGRCKIDGDDWRAQVEDPEQADALQEGDPVSIVRVESNTLVVKPIKTELH